MLRLLPLLFLLAACQPLPHPFADDAPLQSPRDGVGILVRPVAGAPAPLAAKLAETMAAALRDREIPASTQGHNKGSYELVAAAHDEPREASGSSLVVDWELRAADGKPVGHGSASGDTTDIAAAAAPGIARLIQDDPPVTAAGADAAVGLRPITGAPGDGGRALLRAMNDALRRVHVALAAQPGQESFVLTGAVTLSSARAGQQQVKVHWALLHADGREVGQVDQQNAVPAGSLDGAWGDVAYYVANAAAPGIAALIERAKVEGS